MRFLVLLLFCASSWAQVVYSGGVTLSGGVTSNATTPTINFNVVISSLTANDTSACDTLGSAPCSSAFLGLTDHCAPSAPTACDGTTQPYNQPGPPTTASATNTQTLTTVPTASNVNNGDFRSLLYSGFNGTILCVHQPWFGNSQHINIGKDGSSASVVASERNDLIARGCDVVVLNWYGQGSFPDTVTQTWRADLDTCRTTLHGGCLKMAFQADHNTVTGGTLSGFETDVTYTFNNYMNHSSYWTITFGGNTRPVYITFGWGGTLSDTDWGTIKTFIHANLATGAGEPVLITEGENGLAAFANLDGANNWICGTTYDNAASGSVTTQGILGTVQFNTCFQTGNSFSPDHFASTAQANAGNGRVQIHSVYAGFNDTNAGDGNPGTGWGFQSPHTQGRKMARQCGQVWLNSWDRLRINGYSSSSQVKYVLVTTWSDYEEGTAVEPGIDSCYNISNSLATNTLTITLNPTDVTFANTSTVKAIEVYASIDNINAALLTTLSPSLSQSINLTGYGLTIGQAYKIYTRMVGKPGLQNKLSSATNYTR